MSSSNKIIWAKKVFDFIMNNVLSDKKNCLEEEFFHIALNSPLNEKTYDLSLYPLLDKCNYSWKEFYYILKTQDFFLNSKVQEEKHFFQIVDKYYVIKSFYPLTRLF